MTNSSVEDLVRAARQAVREVDVAAAKAMIADGALVIDVREPAENSEAAAKQSVHVPRGVLEMQLPGLLPDADHPIYLHCASGGRAALAAEQLQRLGYRKVTAISCPLDKVLAELG